MLDAEIYHKAAKDSLQSILAEGLRYGRQGRHSREDRVAQANDHLTALCPDQLRSNGVDRNGCIYCYLAVDGRIFDVESGVLVDAERWRVEEGMAKLRLTVDPKTAYVSDLDAFDEVAERIGEAPESTLHKLAERYWQRLVHLPDLCTHYRMDGHTLVRSEQAPTALPSRLERVEVLLTVDVPAKDVDVVG